LNVLAWKNAMGAMAINKKSSWNNIMAPMAKRTMTTLKRNPFRAAWCFVMVNHSDSSSRFMMMHHHDVSSS